jgi:hypothetical protein
MEQLNVPADLSLGIRANGKGMMQAVWALD